MFRRTIKIVPTAQFATIDASGGLALVAFDPRTCIAACDQGGSNAPPETRQAGSHIWEPHINSISATVQADPPPVPAGPAADATRVELTAMLWSWYDYQAADEIAADSSNRQSVLRNRLLISTCRQYLAGWWQGDPGRREFYASNDGNGYRVPRAIVPESRCVDFQNWWVLALQWDFDFAGFRASIEVDYEWRASEI